VVDYSVIDYNLNVRRKRLREATARYRKRAKRRFFWRFILVTEHQLDQLEVRGYLDPNRRGERLDECDAIEAYLAASLRVS
jgi:hypothetical protein